MPKHPAPGEYDQEALARAIAAQLAPILKDISRKLDEIAYETQINRARMDAVLARLGTTGPRAGRQPHGHAYPRTRSVPGCRTHRHR